ncbi:MAG: PEGA domain-containing protein [Verrucomicrobia bacterium]|nr:PEGA domain-containing protein [Verrucomicrobiota bacterium]
MVLPCLCGCATITRGTTQALVIESEPSGASVELSTGLRGKTPATFKVKRSENLVVTISKAGYETVTVNVIAQMSGAGGAGLAGNVILGGLIGAAVDAGTGATKELKPNPVKVNLVRIERGSAPTPP